MFRSSLSYNYSGTYRLFRTYMYLVSEYEERALAKIGYILSSIHIVKIIHNVVVFKYSHDRTKVCYGKQRQRASSSLSHSHTNSILLIPLELDLYVTY